MYRRRLGQSDAEDSAVRFHFNLAIQTSVHARLFAFSQLYIYRKWMTELQRATAIQSQHSLPLFVFLARRQTVFTAENEHHPAHLCQGFQRYSSCESHRVTIISANNLFLALELNVLPWEPEKKGNYLRTRI